MKAPYLLPQFAFVLGDEDIDPATLEWRHPLLATDYDIAYEEALEQCDARGLDPASTRIRIFFRIQAVGYTPWTPVDDMTNYEALLAELDPILEL